MAKRRSNAGLGDMQHEVDEAEDYETNKKIRHGHAQDSRFDEGSTHGIKSAQIVRPSRSAKTMKAKSHPERKWNLGSDHKL